MKGPCDPHDVTVLRFAGAGGLLLEADCRGPHDGPPLVLLHGGGQTRHAWAGVAQRLAGLGLHVVAPDLRGHGRSGWSEDGRYTLETYAEDLRALAASFPQPPIVVGASLGGLTAMVACGEAPRMASTTVVLVDVAHRAQVQGIARIVAFMRERPEGFADPSEAAAAVAAYLPHRAARPDSRGLLHNLRQRPDGRWRWHWDPRLLESLGDSTGMPSCERLLAAAQRIEAPVCIVRGATSDVIDAAIVTEFTEAVPGASTVVVPGAGHMVAGDRNDRFVAAIVPVVTRAVAAARCG